MAQASKKNPGFLAQVWKTLTMEERRLARERERLIKEDSALHSPDLAATKPAEFVDEAAEGVRHEQVEVEKGILSRLLLETRLALTKLKIGKYGLCESCGNQIDRARLKAYPQARYCLDCEKKTFLQKGV